MATLPLTSTAVEAIVLGLATGPVCVASCGPVVVPWMLVQRGGARSSGLGLSTLLAARLGGYMVFAAAAWWLGSKLPREWSGRGWMFGLVQLLLGGALVIYAAGWPRRRCAAPDAGNELVQIGKPHRSWWTGAAVIGFLSGISLCPPFLIAGVRAAEAANLTTALLFFLVFYVGTAIWFLPFLALGFIPRTPTLLTVARMTAVLLACYYAVLGTTVLLAKVFHV